MKMKIAAAIARRAIAVPAPGIGEVPELQEPVDQNDGLAG
jgi:hypothetical protein